MPEELCQVCCKSHYGSLALHSDPSPYIFAWYSFHICRGWKTFSFFCVKFVCLFKKDFFQVSKDDYTFQKQESHGRKLKVTSIGACKEIVLIFCDFNTFLIASQILVLFLSLRFAITSPKRPLPLGETEGAFSTLLYIFKFDHHVCYKTDWKLKHFVLSFFLRWPVMEK